MKTLATFVVCIAVLLFASLAAASPTGAQAMTGPGASNLSTMDPYIGMADISTAAMMVVECKVVDHLPCTSQPQGFDCTGPEGEDACHCIVTPVHLCVQNP